MIADPSYRLGIDYGTSTTVAMLQSPDGRIRPLLFDGSPLLSSAVLLGQDGHLHTGRDAAHLARSFPERLEPNPKRRVGDGYILLGDSELEVRDLVAASLRRVADEAVTVAGPVRDVVMTCPVEWGAARRALLTDAALRAGLGRPRLTPEPVAAATYFARTVSRQLAPGAVVLVYDLGAGTCDVTLLRRGGASFEVVGSAGLDDVGGLDVDAAIVEFLQSGHGRLWTDAATRRQLWDEVRSAKEMLSRTSGTIVAVPALGAEVALGRAEFDRLARPVLQPTITLVETLLERAGVAAGDIAALFLVGGSSRIPLVGTMLHTSLGIGPVVTEQPQTVVAEGALHLDPAGAPPAVPVSGSPVSGSPVSGAPTSPWPAPGPVRGGPVAAPMPVPVSTRHVLSIVLTVAVVVILAVAAVVTYQLPEWFGRGSGARTVGKPRPSGLTSAPGLPSATATPPKYTFDRIGNLCEKIDPAPLKRIFEKQDTEPDASRNPGSSFGSAMCLISLTHVDGSGLGDSIVTVNFNVWVFNDVDVAVKDQKSNLDNAAANKNDPVAEPGIGEEAFTRRKKQANSASVKDVEYALEVRDANLRWIGQIRASRISENGWNQRQQTEIQAALLQTAKESYAKVVAG